MIRRPRVIPILLLKGEGLVKTQKFGDGPYVGDPINAAKIFNDSEVDELILLDITSETARTGPRFEKIENIVNECFMPVCYGGGVRSFAQAERLFSLGLEKVAFNTATVKDPSVVRETSKTYGATSVVASIDVRRKLFGFGGYEVVIEGGRTRTGLDPVEHARKMKDLGVGEILLTSVDHEGTQEGYDLKLVRAVVEAVDMPVIAHGGAGKLEHVREVIRESGASAAAAGSLFVFHGRLKGVLINYPAQSELKRLFA